MMEMTETIVSWRAETLRDRLHRCRIMLQVHGFSNDAERARVNKRLLAAEAKQRKAKGRQMKQQVSA